jgi:hypothetical protein
MPGAATLRVVCAAVFAAMASVPAPLHEVEKSVAI